MKFLLPFLSFTFTVAATCAQSTEDSVPVRLKTFTSAKINNANKLFWSVACFLEYAKFEIQRSYDAVQYTTIDISTADKLRCLEPFEYEDKNASGKVFYRILVGDLDGKVFNSKVTVVYGDVKGFDINSISPSLISSLTTINISSASADNVIAQVINMQGIMVFKKSFLLNQGSNDIPFNFSSLAKGNYFFTCKNSSGISKTQRFIKL